MGETMKIPKHAQNIHGVTLVELLVSIAIFLILLAFMYPTFSFVTRQSEFVGSNEALSARGQKILDYIAEDIRMAGFVVGPKDNIKICPGHDADHPSIGVTAIRHDDNYDVNGVYDSLTFVTAIPLEVNLNSAECITNQPSNTRDYKLDISNPASIGDLNFLVDAPSDCISKSKLYPTGDALLNAKSLVAFETASQIENIYTVTSFSGNTIQISSGLQLSLAVGSPVYAIREYQYVVEDTRELNRYTLGKDCDYSPTLLDPVNGEAGGIDGLQFEFIAIDPTTKQTEVSALPPDDIKDLRAIRIWLLVRSSSADRFYTNDDADPLTPGIQNYQLGTDDGTGSPVTGVEIEPFGDHYRRILLNKTVEVKNLAS
ncbi:MAG: prepilin-type N-terminal cleavage/methylation domain-containing protein [Nitrospirae bacterium]|nr:MAG: prepilin-type N-terminal cleavage/methylation domain-containing protein [Nitrospirota bacterium]